MRKIFILITLFITSASALAEDGVMLRGRLLDQRSKPLPYASIFFKNHPEAGTISDEKGFFYITTPDAGPDTLIISMLGYETIYQHTDDLKKSGTTTFKMKEYLYTIDEAVIKASRNSKKQHRSEVKNLLEKIHHRLNGADALSEKDKFRIASDITVLRDSIPLSIDHLTGTLTHIPEGKTNGKDSITIEIGSYSNYLDSAIRKGIENFDYSKLKKKEQDALEKAEKTGQDKALAHKVVWSANDVGTIFEKTYTDDKNWDFLKQNDTTISVIYSQKKGFLGIITMKQKLQMTVDSRDYSVRAMLDQVTVNINLPFGYKLSPAELEVMNLVNINEDDVEKFKIKKAEVHLKGSTINRSQGERMLPFEKDMKNHVMISDRKDHKIDIENRCTIKVLR